MKIYHTQQGTTLAISLMLLFIITLVGVTSIRSTQIQEKMSHNVQDKMASFQAAETGLVGAETLVGSIPTEVVPTDLAGCPNVTVNSVNFCIVNYTPNMLPEEMDSTWWNTNATDYAITYPAGTLSKNQVSSTPRFYIEQTGFVADSLVIGKAPPTGIHYYRIFSRGTGATDSAVTVLETTFNKRY